MANRVKSPFLDGLVIGMKFTKAPCHLYILFQEVSDCVLNEFLCCKFLFGVRRTSAKKVPR